MKNKDNKFIKDTKKLVDKSKEKTIDGALRTKDAATQVSKWSIGRIFYVLRTMSSAKYILVFYLFITLIGALLLFGHFSQTGYTGWDWENPAAPKAEGYMNFTDALFISASAFSDTGLSTINAAVQLNIFGQTVLAILIVIGGIGWFALKVYLFNILINRPLSFRARETLSAERGSVKIGATKSLIKVAVTTLMVIMIIFGAILTIYFYYAEPETVNGVNLADKLYENPNHNAGVAIRWGFFHSISALNNAGFDIMGSNSLDAYYYNYWLQIIFIFLFVLGGMGYPVIYDVYQYFRQKFIKGDKGAKFKFSLFTKLSVTAYAVIAVLGVGIAYGLETTADDSLWNAPASEYGTHGNKAFAIFFNTMSTRNAGFATISMHDLSRATLIHYVVMMFIGSAPSSTAGGIRTTTMAIIILALWNKIRGRNEVHVFKRIIPKETVNGAFIVFSFSIMIVIVGSLISITSFDVNGGDIPTYQGLAQSNPNVTVGELRTGDIEAYDFTEILFEVGSAFGTTGLSAGITAQLSTLSKLTIILIMFIGQLGVSSSVLIWGNKKRTRRYSFVEQDVSIG